MTDFVREFAEEAAPLFDKNCWRWDKVGVPTADEIETFARELLEEAHKDGEISSGRITATIEPNGEKRLSLILGSYRPNPSSPPTNHPNEPAGFTQIFNMKKEILVTAHG